MQILVWLLIYCKVLAGALAEHLAEEVSIEECAIHWLITHSRSHDFYLYIPLLCCFYQHVLKLIYVSHIRLDNLNRMFCSLDHFKDGPADLSLMRRSLLQKEGLFFIFHEFSLLAVHLFSNILVIWKVTGPRPDCRNLCLLPSVFHIDFIEDFVNLLRNQLFGVEDNIPHEHVSEEIPDSLGGMAF